MDKRVASIAGVCQDRFSYLDTFISTLSTLTPQGRVASSRMFSMRWPIISLSDRISASVCDRKRGLIDHDVGIFPLLAYLSSEDIPQAGGYQEVCGVHVGPNIAHSCQGVGHLLIKVIKVMMMIMM